MSSRFGEERTEGLPIQAWRQAPAAPRPQRRRQRGAGQLLPDVEAFPLQAHHVVRRQVVCARQHFTQTSHKLLIGGGRHHHSPGGTRKPVLREHGKAGPLPPQKVHPGGKLIVKGKQQAHVGRGRRWVG